MADLGGGAPDTSWLANVPIGPNFRSIAERFCAGVDVRDRWSWGRKVPQCFVGKEAAEWLVSSPRVGQAVCFTVCIIDVEAPPAKW